MSGPKVVRVVTREERIATCEGLLARLSAALEDWEVAARRRGTVTEEQIQVMRDRYAQLKAALAADRFDEIERTARSEAQFMQRERERLHAEAVNKETQLRRMRKRTREMEVEMRGMLERALEAAPAGATEEQRALAQKLKEQDDSQSFDRWLAEHPSGLDAETARIERQLAELSLLLESGTVAAFESKLDSASREASADRRAMLLDSLMLELSGAVKEARALDESKARLRALVAELRALGSQGALQRGETVLASLAGDAQTLARIEAETTSALQAEREALAARARREAVLNGLAALGYQVNEGLETAWVNEGRVVVKRPAQPGYGVELGGKAENGRLQARVVAIRKAGDLADNERDKDAERMWCSDFGKLQEQVAAAGGGLVIEKALAVGATPLKAVEDAEAGAASADWLTGPRERTLPRP